MLGYEVWSVERGVVLGLSLWMLMFQGRQGLRLKQQGSADHLLVVINSFLLPWQFVIRSFNRYKLGVESWLREKWSRITSGK